MDDPVTDDDLCAYVDGQLDVLRRLDVEAHLARHPDDAARVMADLHDRDALREAFAPALGPIPDRLNLAARRLDRAIGWMHVGTRLRRAATIVVLVGAGWLAHTEVGTFGVPDTYASPIDPPVVEEAQQAHQAVQIRARTHSQPAILSYDRADLEAATGLTLPALPADWRVRDVQVFPARAGTGVEVAIDAGNLGDLALFATRRSERTAGRTDSHALTRSSDGTTAFWQDGQTTYALTGSREALDVSAAAARLAAR